MVLTVMKIKQKIATFILLPVLAFTGAAVLSTNTYAENESCGTKTAILACPAPAADAQDYEKTGLWRILLVIINIMTGLAALAALGGIVYGAVLYTSAGGSQEQVKKAFGVFTNVGIGVIAFAIMYAALNFLIPGGVF
jgi:hypothetical protein